KPAAPAESPASKNATEVDEAIKTFEKKLGEWKGVLKELRALQLKAQANPAEIPELLKQWDDLIAKGNTFLPELRELGKAAYLALPNGDPELSRFLAKLTEDEVAHDDYDSALEITQLLIDNGYDDKTIYNQAGIANFATNHFDKAEEYFNK